MKPNDPVYLRAESLLAETQERARDLEGFLKMYGELVTGAFAMPSGDEPSPAPIERPAAKPLPPGRPAVSLNDRNLSISDAAVKVLRHALRPMKALEVAETMLAWGYPYDNPKGINELRATVGGVLSREVREGSTFTRPAYGTFALKEWGGENTDAGGDDADVVPAQSPLFDHTTTIPGFHTGGDAIDMS